MLSVCGRMMMETAVLPTPFHTVCCVCAVPCSEVELTASPLESEWGLWLDSVNSMWQGDHETVVSLGLETLQASAHLLEILPS